MSEMKLKLEGTMSQKGFPSNSKWLDGLLKLLVSMRESGVTLDKFACKDNTVDFAVCGNLDQIERFKTVFGAKS